MLLAGSTRLLLLTACVFLVIILGFSVRPRSVATWSTANAPAAVDHDFLSHHAHEDKPSEAQHNADIASDTALNGFDSSSWASESVIYPIVASTITPSPQVTQHTSASGTIDTDLYGHNVVSSRLTKNGKYIPIDFGDHGSYNPNLIPHPWKSDTWVMIAQGKQTGGDAQGIVYSIELVCNAVFTGEKMKCTRSPTTVPIASTVSTHCTGQYEWFNYFIGGTDPRVFYGPDRPYITYGSASQYTCLGQYIHDLRRLVAWNELDAANRTNRFFWPTELQRPEAYSPVEKNWFAFWDKTGEMYLHYDIFPKRVFARVSHDGANITSDLAPAAAQKDYLCLDRHMPKLQDREHIHQATNSLSVTMCQRSDESCDVEQNTFIFTTFQHKQYKGHNLYEPYIMMFKQTSPFEMHAISSKPFWINGRGKAGEVGSDRPNDQTQMMYMTSMSWLAQNMTYHGYLDDELFLSFGIEDKEAGVIDVVASDLLRDLNICS